MPEHLQAVGVGQAEVEDDDVEVSVAEEQVGAAPHADRPVAVGGEGFDEGVADSVVVLDHRDLHVVAFRSVS